MFRRVGCLTALLLLFAYSAPAQDIQRGTIKTIDAEKKSITVTVGGKDRMFTISDDTRIRSTSGGELDGKTVLLGLRPAAGNAPAGNADQNPGGGIVRGRIKKMDIDNLKLTLTIDGKDRELTLTESTQVLGSNADSLKELFPVSK